MVPGADDAGKPVAVMSALILRAIVDETIMPGFEKTGGRAEMIWDPTVGLMRRIADGQKADAIVAIDWAIDELAAKGRLDPASRRPLARASVGVGVVAGAPRPDISTQAALRKTLLDTPTLVYSRTGASGIFFDKMIDDFGIGDAIRSKALVIDAGLTGEKLVSGEVALAIQQVSELLAVPGVDLVGPLPAELQATTDFSVAVFTDALASEAAGRFLEQLFTPAARNAYGQAGLEPRF
ncbi:molybdate ABC transporter substrate-binding protein [Rhizobium sp. CF142]|uniref:molybdate ABC transporter substrate-binding protein n=1 Tax=Rhizobium sp. CF142 TaxID=1144314 RepID=UPI00026EF7AD|nr:substrate-binding domain-containing protein [Rhizobium sp. CF142]EJJ30020.1 ABC-type molybdate transport system, periplasmic component [Rhizobium sp. CF142]